MGWILWRAANMYGVKAVFMYYFIPYVVSQTILIFRVRN